MKADLAAGIFRALRERKLTGAKAANVTGVQEADVSRIRNGNLARFTINRFVTILNRLDHGVAVQVTIKTGLTGNQPPAI